MAINPVTLDQVQRKILSIGTAMNSMFVNDIVPFTSFVVNLGVSGLQSTYGLNSADATLLFNSCQDLANFYKVYQGLMYVTAGATVNSGVPTANDGTHWGYPFNISVSQCIGLGT